MSNINSHPSVPVTRTDKGTFPPPSGGRTAEGKFVEGVSGNPKGRPKGSRNQITLVKESVELQLREQMEPYMPQVIEKIKDLALKGDTRMLKLLAEIWLSKGTTDTQTKAQEKVEITINGPAPVESTRVKVIEAEIIED